LAEDTTIKVEVRKTDLVFIVHEDGKAEFLTPSPDTDVTQCQMRGLADLASDIISGVGRYICKGCASHDEHLEVDPSKIY